MVPRKEGAQRYPQGEADCFVFFIEEYSHHKCLGLNPPYLITSAEFVFDRET